MPFLQYQNFDLSDLEDRRYEDWKKESESAELFQNHTIGPMGGVQCQYMIKHHGHKYSPSLEGHPAGKKESRKPRDF